MKAKIVTQLGPLYVGQIVEVIKNPVRDEFYCYDKTGGLWTLLASNCEVIHEERAKEESGPASLIDLIGARPLRFTLNADFDPGSGGADFKKGSEK